MKKLLTKNVLISIAFGFLIIIGTFFSSRNKTNLITTKTDDSSASLLTPENNTIAQATIPAEGTTIDLYRSMKPHTLSEVKISNDTSRSAKRDFGLAVASLFKKYSTPSQDPAGITNTMYQTKNYSNVSKLQPAIKNYEDAAAELMGIAVPESMASTILNLSNNLDRMGQLVENMANIETDPLVAIASARQFSEEVNVQISLLDQINQYFSDNNIAFSQSEQSNVYENIAR